MALTPAALLVLAFLEFHPRPVCTFAFPRGVVTRGTTCPRHNMLNNYEIFDTLSGLLPCVRRFTT
jgi:hypothetical protein